MSENEEGEPPTSNDEAQTDVTFTPTTSNEDALQELIQSLPDDEPAPAEEEPPPPPPEEEAPEAAGEEAKTDEVQIEVIYENSPPSDATESQKSDAENTETDEFSDLSGTVDSGGEREADAVTSDESILKSPEEIDSPDEDLFVDSEDTPTPDAEGESSDDRVPNAEGEQPDEAVVEPASETEDQVEGEVEPAPETEDDVGGEVEPAPETEDQVEGEVEPAPETQDEVGGEVEPAPETEDEVGGEVEPVPETEDQAEAPEAEDKGELQGETGDEVEKDEENFEDTTEEIVDESQQEDSPEKQGEGEDTEDQPPTEPVEVVEVEDWVFEAIEIPKCVCEPMWDYSLSVSASLVEPQIVDRYVEETLEENFGECRPMWDFDLSVPASLAVPQFKLADDINLDLARDDYHCVPMWDYDLMAPLKRMYGIDDEIIWELSHLNFLHVLARLNKDDDDTKSRVAVEELNKLSQYVQTYLHFEPSFVIKVEDLLIDEEEIEHGEYRERLPMTSYPEISFNQLKENQDKKQSTIVQTEVGKEVKKKLSDTSIEFWYPSHLNLEDAQEAIRAGKGPLDTEITFFLKIVLEGAATAMQIDGGPLLSTDSALFGWYAPHAVEGTVHGEGKVGISGILICSSSFDSAELIFLSSLAQSLVDGVEKMKNQFSGDESPEDVYRLLRALIFQILGLKPESADFETFSTSMAERLAGKLQTTGDIDIWAELKNVIESEEENVVLLEECGEAFYLSRMMNKLLIRLALPVPAGPEEILSNIKAMIEECIADKVVLKGQRGIIPAAYSQDLIEMVDFITQSLLEKVLKGEDLSSTVDETMTDIVSQRQQLGLEGSLTTMLAQSLFVRALMMSTPAESETCDMNLQLKLTIDKNIAQMLALRGESEITSDQLPPDMKTALEKTLADILLTRLQGQVQSGQEPTSLAPVIEEGVAEVMMGKSVPPALAGELKSILEGNAIIIVLRGRLPAGAIEQEPVNVPAPEERAPSLSVEVRISPTPSTDEVEQIPADETDYEEYHKLLDETLLQVEIQVDEGISHMSEVEEDSQSLEAVEKTGPSEEYEDEYEEMHHIVEDNVERAIEDNVERAIEDNVERAIEDNVERDVEGVPSTTDSFVSAESGIPEIDDEFQDAKDTFEPDLAKGEGIPEELIEEIIHHVEEEVEKDMEIKEVPPTSVKGVHTYTQVELEIKHEPGAPEATYEVEILAPRMKPISKAKGVKKASTDEALKRFRSKFAQEIAPVREKLKELHDKVAALDIPAFAGVNLCGQFQQPGKPICYCKKSLCSSSRSKR